MKLVGEKKAEKFNIVLVIIPGNTIISWLKVLNVIPKAF